MGLFGDDTSFTTVGAGSGQQSVAAPDVPSGWAMVTGDPTSTVGNYYQNLYNGQNFSQAQTQQLLGTGRNSLGQVTGYQDPNSYSNQNFDLIANNYGSLSQNNTLPFAQQSFERSFLNNPNTVQSDPTAYLMNGDPNFAANMQAGLNMQAAAAGGRTAPGIDTGATNLIMTGAGNAINNANNTNFASLGNAYNLAGTANGAGYQGQIGAAGALMDQTQGAAAAGQLYTANQLDNAAYGPGAAGQLTSANQLISAANGPATQGQLGTANALALAAGGAPVTNQMALGNQLAANANGMGIAGQYALANQLAAAGRLPTGPSVAQLQLRQGANQSMAQQAALASSARGGNTALALQNSMQNQGQAMGQLNQSSALLRAQEDMANRQLQAQTLGQAAGLYGNATAQQNAALQGAAGLYGNAGNLAGNLLGAANQGYGQAANAQANLLGAANQGYGSYSNTQGNLIGAANQGYTAAGNLQNSLLGTAGNIYGNAATTQQNAFSGAGTQLNNIAGNQLGQANTQANIGSVYANLASQQAQNQIQQSQQNDAYSLGLQNLGNQYVSQQLQTTSNYDQNRTQNQANILTNQYANRDKTGEGTITGSGGGDKALEGAVGVATALSDVRSKKNIKPAAEDVSQAFRAADANVAAMQEPTLYPMLPSQPGPAPGVTGRAPMVSQLPNAAPIQSPYAVGAQRGPVDPSIVDPYPDAQAYSYLYKDPNQAGARDGTQYGPMAQDLEKTPAGASVVGTDKSGKKFIDTDRLSLLSASELAKQRKEIDALIARSGALRTLRSDQQPYPSLYDPNGGI